MSVLHSVKETKKEAKQLTVAQLNTAIETLQAVLKEREVEAQTLNEIEALALARGFSLKQLGLVQAATANVEPDAAQVDKAEHNDRPIKPKLKSLNAESLYFYNEDGQLKLLATHTMKKGLQNRGIEVVPFAQLSKGDKEKAQLLIEDATQTAILNYNKKVDVWNAYAEKQGLEILAKA